MKNRLTNTLLSALLGLLIATPAAALTGKILDAQSGKPIADAIVTIQKTVTRTDSEGNFRIDAAPPGASSGVTLGARAVGYGRTSQPLPASNGQPLTIKLPPLKPKGLYLSFYGFGSRVLRNAALDLIDQTELNALVIDVKGDRGMIPYKSKVALAAEIGGQRIITVRDIKEQIDRLHSKGVYLIARVVVFKDTLLATAHPEWAIKGPNGKTWQDREQLSWVDPFFQDVWKYNIDIAEEAAALGFDEIQFDYVRFPDTVGLVFSQPNTEANRVQAISGFLAAARQRLIPYNVFVAADIFGYVSWNTNDTFIGQKLENLHPQLDYLSPMLYPSGFQFGIPNYRDPVVNAYEIIGLTLKRAADRTAIQPTRFRPWLQSFKDYAFDRRQFGATEIRRQIDASEKFGSGGWMLWNPRNSYSKAGLKDKQGNLLEALPAAQPALPPAPKLTKTAPASAAPRTPAGAQVSVAEATGQILTR